MNTPESKVEVLAYTYRNLTRLLKGEISIHAETLGDSWSLLRYLYGNEVDTGGLMGNFSILGKKIAQDEIDLRPVHALACGIGVMFDKHPKFDRVRALKERIPSFLGEELIPTLRLSHGVDIMGMTVGAEVLTAAILDLSGVELKLEASRLGEAIWREYGNSTDKVRLKHVMPAASKWIATRASLVS